MLNQVISLLTAQGETKTLTSTFHLDLTDPNFDTHHVKIDISGKAEVSVVVENFGSTPAAHAESILKLNGTTLYTLTASIDPPYGDVGIHSISTPVMSRLDVTELIGTVLEFVTTFNCDSNDLGFASANGSYILTALCDPPMTVNLQCSPSIVSVLQGGGVVYTTLTARSMDDSLIGQTLNLSYETLPSGISVSLSSATITIGAMDGTSGTDVLVTATVDSTVPVGSYFITFHGINTIDTIVYDAMTIFNIIVNPTGGGGGSGGS